MSNAQGFPRILLAAAPLGLLACGGDDGNTGATDSPQGVEEDGGPEGGLPEPEEGLSFVLDQGEFTVQPGEELTYCVRMPIPPELRGRDLALMGWDWDLPPHTHHYFVAYSTEPFDGDGPEPCDGVDPIVPAAAQTGGGIADLLGDGDVDRLGEGKILFGAGVGTGSYRSSEQYGRLMADGGHFVTNHHALNTSPDPATLYARFTLHVREAEEVPHLTNALNCLTMDVDVEPLASREVTATCTAPFDLDVVMLASHAHNHLVRFETRFFDGEKTLPEVLYESTDWDSPRLEWQEVPLRLEKGQGLTFTCHYENRQEVPIQFGVGVENEMCATMNAYAYPPDRKYERPPTLGALITDNALGTCLRYVDGAISVSTDCSLIDTENLPISIPFF